MKKNHGLSLISSWFEKEIEQERRTEYRAKSPFFQKCGLSPISLYPSLYPFITHQLPKALQVDGLVQLGGQGAEAVPRDQKQRA
jgi:hypothetical protein